jgi:hypothetical protein
MLAASRRAAGTSHSNRGLLALCVAVMTCAAANPGRADPPASHAAASKAKPAPASADRLRRIVRGYVRPSDKVLLAALRRKLGPAAPASLGTGVTVTTRAPSAGDSAFLFFFRASTFDPNYGPQGVTGNDTGTQVDASRVGITIQPTPNTATLVDCDIAGTSSIFYEVQVFSSTGAYVGDVAAETLTSSSNHWTMIVPWNPQFADYGMFRLMISPMGKPYWDLWGCSVVPAG